MIFLKWRATKWKAPKGANHLFPNQHWEMVKNKQKAYKREPGKSGQLKKCLSNTAADTGLERPTGNMNDGYSKSELTTTASSHAKLQKHDSPSVCESHLFNPVSSVFSASVNTSLPPVTDCSLNQQQMPKVDTYCYVTQCLHAGRENRVIV